VVRRSPRRSLLRLVIGSALASATVLRAGGQPQAQAENVCDIRTTERVIAIADVHGAHTRFQTLLKSLGLIDQRDRWTGGRTHLVQTGDVLDRGPDSKLVLDLLRRLERDARRAGGRVWPLLGNHEVMRMVGDWRYVSDGETAAFRTPRSAELRQNALNVFSQQAETRAKEQKAAFDPAAFKERFERDYPLGALEMTLAFQKDGDYGEWLRQRPTMVKINGIVYMHGGVSEPRSMLGCEGINAVVIKELSGPPVPPEQLLSQVSSAEDGPLWYRGLATEPEDTFAPTLETILQRLRARAIVVGHTPTEGGRIVTRFGGRVVQIDTGMLDGTFFPGGVPSALEIKGDTMTAVYLDRREPLTTPALAASAATR
jgi:hypothetical protein